MTMTNEISDVYPDVHKHFKVLAKGLMQDEATTAYIGYKALYELGTESIPYLREILLSSEWSDRTYPRMSKYLTGIFSLVHDIDESASKNLLLEMIDNGIPAHIRVQLESVCSFSLKNYRSYSVRGIDVFEHTELKTSCLIRPYIERWLANVPADDLVGIDRIYIIRSGDIKAAGNYTPVLYKINLVWEINTRKAL